MQSSKLLKKKKNCTPPRVHGKSFFTSGVIQASVSGAFRQKSNGEGVKVD